MTEFTSEKMAEWRHMIKNIRSQPVESGREYLLTGVLANALDHIERQTQRIAELEQERRWIPVSEPVEGNNLEILCYSNDAPHYECYFAIYIDGIFGEYESGKFLEIFPKPTHYMYKPKPPKYKPAQEIK